MGNVGVSRQCATHSSGRMPSGNGTIDHSLIAEKRQG
jgi:hypothetical protein